MPTLTLLLAVACALPAHAARVVRVDVRGVAPELIENIRNDLSLEDALNKEVSDRRLDYLLEEATTETREALEPFGFYSPTIRVLPSSDRNALVVTIEVKPGEPVRVRKREAEITDEGAEDFYLKRDLEELKPAPGDVFNHEVYETAKATITRRLAERGYFDAEPLVHRVEVTRAQAAADIALKWDSGLRYDMGHVTFVQDPKTIIRPQLLEKLIYWKEGEYYHQGRLDRLRQSLTALDYFGRIDIEPHPEAAKDYLVPVTVTLTPAKRSIYTFGLSYGTDSGGGFLAGVERRYLNSRGHKALAQVDYAQKRKTATLQYRVPAFKWLDGWYTASLQYADEQTRYIDNRRLELVASRSGELNRKLNLVASLHLLRERWAYGEGAERTPYTYASMVYPSLRAEYIDVDDRLYARRGYGGWATLRGGMGGTGGEKHGFAQIRLRGQWYRGLGPADRILARGEVGYTLGPEALTLPPSLRFFAGGDRSIRGYNWREVGPKLLDAKGHYAYAMGARNMVNASIEYERYVRGPWGVAAFVDGGSAFNGRNVDWHTGVGIGARWKSPVGPVRLDIARGLKHPDSAFTLHINVGADL